MNTAILTALLSIPAGVVVHLLCRLFDSYLS